MSKWLQNVSDLLESVLIFAVMQRLPCPVEVNSQLKSVNYVPIFVKHVQLSVKNIVNTMSIARSVQKLAEDALMFAERWLANKKENFLFLFTHKVLTMLL